MKEFKGTPGPWHLNEKTYYHNGTKCHEINYGGDGEVIAEAVYNKEDAALIAAAPELLEALQFVLPMFAEGFEPHAVVSAAINKALNITP